MSEPDPTDSQRMQEWARKQLADSSALILDTETTGLGRDAEVCQIGIIVAQTGQVLLDTLVRPTKPPEREASRIHGLTMDMLKDAPTIADLVPQLRQILGSAPVLVYNAGFDTRILEQSLRAMAIPTGQLDDQAALFASKHGATISTYELPLFGADDYIDVMEPYSAWCGDWSEYHGNYRFQKLPGGDHTALGDCRATREVLRRMANLRDISLTVLITPEEAEYMRWDGIDSVNTELVQALLTQLLADLFWIRSASGRTDHRMLMSDWKTLWNLDQGRVHYHPDQVRKEIAARVAFGRGNDPLSTIARLAGDIKPGKLTKVQLEELLGRVYQLSKEGLGRE